MNNVFVENVKHGSIRFLKLGHNYNKKANKWREIRRVLTLNWRLHCSKMVMFMTCSVNVTQCSSGRHFVYPVKRTTTATATMVMIGMYVCGLSVKVNKSFTLNYIIEQRKPIERTYTIRGELMAVATSFQKTITRQ